MSVSLAQTMGDDCKMAFSVHAT